MYVYATEPDRPPCLATLYTYVVIPLMIARGWLWHVMHARAHMRTHTHTQGKGDLQFLVVTTLFHTRLLQG